MKYSSAFTLFAVAGILVIFSLGHAEGIECYECLHADISDVSSSDIEKAFGTIINVDGSCKSGKKPKGKYSETCSGAYNTTNHCMKLTVDETVAGSKVKITLRGCFPTYNTTAKDACSTRTARDLRMMFPNGTAASKSQAALGLLLLQYPEANSAKGNACFCKDDECNSAISVNPVHALFVIGLGLVSYFASF